MVGLVPAICVERLASRNARVAFRAREAAIKQFHQLRCWRFAQRQHNVSAFAEGHAVSQQGLGRNPVSGAFSFCDRPRGYASISIVRRPQKADLPPERARKYKIGAERNEREPIA